MSEQPVINEALSEELTKAIHEGNAIQTEKLLNLIKEIGGVIQVEYDNAAISNMPQGK